jgi:hypothetical protein
MGWSGHSWLLSSVVEEESIGKLASVFFLMVALGFVIGAIGYAFSRERWATVLVGTALLSTFLYTATWDGRFTSLPETGAPGVLVDVAVPVRLLVLIRDAGHGSTDGPLLSVVAERSRWPVSCPGRGSSIGRQGCRPGASPPSRAQQWPASGRSTAGRGRRRRRIRHTRTTPYR